MPSIFFSGSDDKSPPQVRVAFSKKDGAAWKTLFNSRPVNWCKLFDGSNPKITPFQKALFTSISERIKSSLKRCPFQPGTYGVKDLSFQRKFTLMLPEGIYRVESQFYNKLDSLIVGFSMLIELEK
jgi:hypothetical protein